MSHVEKTISYLTTGLVLLLSFVLLSWGPFAGRSAADACAELEALPSQRLEQLIEKLAADPARPETLDAATLTRCGAGDLPAAALPCLQERLNQHLAARPS